eukprot:gene29410-10962_t
MGGACFRPSCDVAMGGALARIDSREQNEGVRWLRA